MSPPASWPSEKKLIILMRVSSLIGKFGEVHSPRESSFLFLFFTLVYLGGMYNA